MSARAMTRRLGERTQVENNALFSAVPDGLAGVAALVLRAWRIDTYHASAVVAQKRSSEGPGRAVGQVENRDAVQRASHVRVCLHLGRVKGLGSEGEAHCDARQGVCQGGDGQKERPEPE